MISLIINHDGVDKPKQTNMGAYLNKQCLVSYVNEVSENQKMLRYRIVLEAAVIGKFSMLLQLWSKYRNEIEFVEKQIAS